MSEAMKNLALLVWAVCAINTNAYAQENPGVTEEAASSPTVVFGEAQTKGGGEDMLVVEQPDGAANPLGNPIPEQVAPAAPAPEMMTAPEKMQQSEQIAPVAEGNRVVAPQAAEQLGKDFQNTLEEANGMIYDVQAYPEANLPVLGDPSNPETIYSPNVNP